MKGWVGTADAPAPLSTRSPMSINEDAPRQVVDPAAESGLDIKDLLGILRRRKRVILSTVLLLTSLAVLVALQLTPQIHRHRDGDDRPAQEQRGRRRIGHSGAGHRRLDGRESDPADQLAVPAGAIGRRSGHFRGPGVQPRPAQPRPQHRSCRLRGRSRRSSRGCRTPGWSPPGSPRSRSTPPKPSCPI